MKTCHTPFLGGTLQAAIGVPSLSLRSRVSLHSVVIVRETPGAYLTIIEPLLRLDDRADRDRKLQELLGAMTIAIERHVRTSSTGTRNSPAVARAAKRLSL